MNGSRCVSLPCAALLGTPSFLAEGGVYLSCLVGPMRLAIEDRVDLPHGWSFPSACRRNRRIRSRQHAQHLREIALAVSCSFPPPLR